MAEHLHAIRRELVVESHIAFLHQDTAPELLAGPPDFVIDAIDAEAPKVALLYYCATHGIPVVACMGAAARHDASQIRVADLSETSNCPLARNVRGKLKKLGVTRGITAIYSLERPRPSLPPDDNEPRLHKGRVRRRLPSLITIPGIFGFMAAGLVLDHLAGVASPPARQQDP
jgi:tRNA A37 threonylcarbamoyladenosine dehydratase